MLHVKQAQLLPQSSVPPTQLIIQPLPHAVSMTNIHTCAALYNLLIVQLDEQMDSYHVAA